NVEESLMSTKSLAGMVATLSLVCCNSADATIRITEFMYQGSAEPPSEAGEFVELTNLGTDAVDFSGWSYDDDSREPGVFDLTDFGLVQPNESVIFTDWNADLFRNSWGLAQEVKIIGFSSPGLG